MELKIIVEEVRKIRKGIKIFLGNNNKNFEGKNKVDRRVEKDVRYFLFIGYLEIIIFSLEFLLFFI